MLNEFKPLLYELGNAAAKEGHDAAIEFLVRLPDMDSVSTGWLLNYQDELALQHEPVLSKCWRFRSAYNIDSHETTYPRIEKTEV